MFNWICSPAATELETTVLNWLAALLHLPQEMQEGSLNDTSSGGGIITGSASESILTAMIAARDRALDCLCGSKRSTSQTRDSITGKLVVIGSQTTHSSGEKAARILGLSFYAAKVQFSMSGAELNEAIKTCKAAGLIPFFVIATIGMLFTFAPCP